MEFIHLTNKDYVRSEWSGGTTTQIAIMPRDAKYSDRDFLWRVSSATVDLEESDFTSLPDYQRWISTLKGTMLLSHNGCDKITLEPYAVHSFDGNDATHSWGSCTDFNLMLRKEKTSGSLQALYLDGGACFGLEIIPERGQIDLLCYCAEGIVEVVQSSNTGILEARDTILMTANDSFQLQIRAVEHSAVFLAIIHY